MWYWAAVVAERRSSGEHCCLLCASAMNDMRVSFCVDCQAALDDPNLPEISTTVLRHIRGPIVENELLAQIFEAIHAAIIPDYILQRLYQRVEKAFWRYLHLLDNCTELHKPFTDLKQLIRQWHSF